MSSTQRLLFTAILSLCLIAFVHGDVRAQQQELRILHVNDVHGFAVEYGGAGAGNFRGGLAFFAGQIDKLRGEKPTLLLAAGDMIQGNNWANLTKGKSVIELMNALEFDAMVVGNHEFDFGQDVLKQRISEAQFPVLGANVEGIPSLKPFVVKELAGVKVAIIGVITDETPIATHPKNVAGLRFGDPFEKAKELVKELRGKVDLVVLLTHLGFHADMELAKKVGGIDVIVGGHTHTKPGQQTLVGRTVVVQAWEHALALGVIDLTLKQGRVTNSVSKVLEMKIAPAYPNNRITAIIDKYQRQVDTVLGENVGETAVDLKGTEVRLKETNLGNLATDAIRKVASADVALLNGGAIRTGIGKGPILLRDVYDALPFDNYVVALRMKGDYIRELLEHGVAAVESEDGRFPQVSGLRFVYAITAPPGARVKAIEVGGQPLDPTREYVVATNDFLIAGGDGYKTFARVLESADAKVIGGAIVSSRLAYNDPGKYLRDVLVDFLRSAGAVAPQVEGRITEEK